MRCLVRCSRGDQGPTPCLPTSAVLTKEIPLGDSSCLHVFLRFLNSGHGRTHVGLCIQRLVCSLFRYFIILPFADLYLFILHEMSAYLYVCVVRSFVSSFLAGSTFVFFDSLSLFACASFVCFLHSCWHSHPRGCARVAIKRIPKSFEAHHVPRVVCLFRGCHLFEEAATNVPLPIKTDSMRGLHL